MKIDSNIRVYLKEFYPSFKDVEKDLITSFYQGHYTYDGKFYKSIELNGTFYSIETSDRNKLVFIIKL